MKEVLARCVRSALEDGGRGRVGCGGGSHLGVLQRWVGEGPALLVGQQAALLSGAAGWVLGHESPMTGNGLPWLFLLLSFTHFLRADGVF